MDFIDLKSSCIIADKVYSQYQQRKCFKNVTINIDNNIFESIVFKPGFIIENTLVITNIDSKPNFRRVRFCLRIPFEITTKNGNIIEGYLPDIYKDIVMFIPQVRDEFAFEILVETSSKLLTKPAIVNNQLSFAVGTFIIIKSIGKVQLLIPSFGFCPEPPLCEKYTENFIYDDFKSRKFPDFYPTQNKANTKDITLSQSHSDEKYVTAPDNLTIEKHITSGPLEVNEGELNTWQIEIRVVNDGYDSVSNVVVTDTLLLDNLDNINILSITQGTTSQKDNQIFWDIGILNSGTTVIFAAEVTGSFDIIDKTVNVENSQ